MAHWNKDGISCPFAVSNCCSPSPSAIAYQKTNISCRFDLLLALLLHPLFSKSIDEEECFSHTDGWQVEMYA